MRRMIDFIREFKFGRPQQIAALLLVAFIALASYRASHADLSRGAVTRDIALGYDGAARLGLNRVLPRSNWKPWPLQNGVIAELAAGLAASGYLYTHDPLGEFGDPAWRSIAIAVRLPFVAFGLWLAGALWWVTRRLYDNFGGYVALAMYCFSVPTIMASSTALPDVIAAWGLYGLIYTAIGVAHTLYAPPRKWPPRIVLLGVALGVTASAHMGAALTGLALSAAFLLYLAPGRRLVSCGILGIAVLEALVLDAALHGFRLQPIFQEIYAWREWHVGFFGLAAVMYSSRWQSVVLIALIVTALLTFVFWKRTRYFGNWTPLLAALVFSSIAFDDSCPIIWALPFVFTFIGGIFADLLETKRRRIVIWSLGSALTGYAALAIAGVLAIPK
jgi:hypothetical protein